MFSAEPAGPTLRMRPDEITIWTVFNAVDPTPMDELIGVHPSPEPRCSVGNNIYALFEKPYGIVADAVKEGMQSYTLQQMLDDYNYIQNHKEVFS